MNETETRFIEQYKKIEAELNRRFVTKRGVTEYINRMESTEQELRYRVPTWRKELRSLKHLRWLRNRIVHDEGETDCEEFDVIETEDFYAKLLCGLDPLSLAAEDYRSENSEETAPVSKAMGGTPEPNTETNKQQGGGVFIAVAVIGAILLLLLLFAKHTGLV